MTQPRMRRAHRVHPAIMSTAVPDAATHCPTFSTTFRISGCTRGGCTRNLFPDITCSNMAGDLQTAIRQPLDVRYPQKCAYTQEQCLLSQHGPRTEPDGLMLGIAPDEGAFCKVHLFDSIEFVEPGGIVPGGQAALALQALMAVHQPGLELLALRTEAHLQENSVLTSVLLPCQAHPAKEPYSVPLVSA